MGQTAVKLTEVAGARKEIHGVAEQALEWVRQSEERVAAVEKELAEAEAQAEKAQAEIKLRAKAALGKIGEEGRERVAAARERAKAAEQRAARAEQARDRAEKAYERAQRSTEAEREEISAQMAAAKAQADEAAARAVKRTEEEASKRTREVLEKAQAEADRRVAAAEQRAAEAEARADEAHRTAVRIEREIEERVMQGTEDVRRESEERVRRLIEKVEGEAEEKARARAEEQLQAESERIRGQAEQREERLRRAADEEIKASAKRARRQAMAAVEETAPSWEREATADSGAGYRTFRVPLASGLMREVRVRDTLSGETRPLPRDQGVGIYACGPTVYSRIHIGNARPYVIFMLLARFLRSEGYDAKLVINVTDINDKIYDAAGAVGEPSAEFARRMTRAYFEDTDRLGLGRPDAEPLATETIDAIVGLISDLIASGHAYESGGDVYFRVRSFARYGKLSNRRTEEMDQGEEAGSASLKDDPLDFALWKAHKEGEDTSWDSPWGPGRPGWHIECSAMAEAELGPSFAIHGGGSDLVFPHHENEIAQSEGAGRPFAQLWMHNGMIETDAEKMSKSEGNIFQLSEALDRYGREAVIDYLISGHYRQPLAFGPEQMEQAVARVERLRNFFREHGGGEPGGPPAGTRVESPGEGPEFTGSQVPAGGPPGSRSEALRDALADDFNTPRAMAEVFELVAEANRGDVPRAPEALREMLALVGLESLAEAEGGADEEAEALLAAREEARAAKDFERADEIRDRLTALGWEVRDSAEGPRLVAKS